MRYRSGEINYGYGYMYGHRRTFVFTTANKSIPFSLLLLLSFFLCFFFSFLRAVNVLVVLADSCYLDNCMISLVSFT